MSKLNINKLRKDTTGCQQVLHFNNAGAALQPKPVIASIKHHIDLEAAMGDYEAAEALKSENELFYDLAAHLINCSRDEVAYASKQTALTTIEKIRSIKRALVLMVFQKSIF